VNGRPVRLGPSAALRCRRRVHLDWAVGLERPVASASAHRAITELAEHRAAILSEVRAARGLPVHDADRSVLLPRDAEPSGDLLASAALASERPAPVVISPALPDSQRSGWPDLLVWAGDGYQPVIIRAHRTLDPGRGAWCSTFGDPAQVQPHPTRRPRRNRVDVMALAHHYRQLTELGWASSRAHGGVIGRGDPGDRALVVWHDLDPRGDGSALADYDRRFADRLAVAGAAAGGAEPLAFPSRIAECRRCPWWPRCSAELEQTGDVSLLVAGGDVALLQAAGVRTIDQLAQLPAELPAEVAAALRLSTAPVGQSRVRARAFQRGIPLVRIGRRGAIRRADVELDVDSESYGQDGAYLWGTYLSGADVGFTPGYRPFATWQPLPSVTEAEVFVQFHRFLLDVRAAAAARGLSFAAFCYARTAEERWMRSIPLRYPEVPGMPTTREVAEFCASPDWVDVHAELKRLFLPTGSLRLKAVAGALGFSWRDPEPGGENSLAWYRAAVGAGSAAADPELAQRILRYNEDDVRATLEVREWLGRNGMTLPTVAELQAAAGVIDVTDVTDVTGAASAAPRPAG